MGQFSLDEYSNFLTGREGRKKSERNAKGIATNVSKFHLFVIPKQEISYTH